MPLAIKKHYLTSEITPEMLTGMVNESVQRHSRMLDYVQVVPTDAEKIEVSVFVQQIDKPSPLVGFNDTTPLSKGQTREGFDAYPVHIKEGYPIDTTSPFLVRQGNDLGVSAEGLVVATDHLERNRLDTLRMIWLTVLSEKSLVWSSQRDPNAPSDIGIRLPYDDSFNDLTALTGTDQLNNDASKIFELIDAAQEEYYEATGFFAELMFVNGTTFNVLKGHPQVAPTIRAQATDEPDRSVSTREEVEIGGLTVVALRGQYLKSDGTMGKPLANGLGVLATTRLLSDGFSAIRWVKAANLLNDRNASAPRYGVTDVSKLPPKVVVDMYDNGIPVLPHRKALAHWIMWS